MKMVKIILFAFCAALSAGAAEQDKGVFGSAFLDLDRDDKVELVRTMNETLSKVKKDETAAQKAKRIQTVYSLNRDAVRAAKDADKKRVIAEVFATAPLEALPTISDRFAKELFSRKAAGLNEKDDSFVEFAAASLLRITGRLRQQMVARWYPGARSAFAVISFIKAAEGKPEDIREALTFYVLTGSEKLARTKWIPEAMGDDGKEPSYKSILEAGLEGEEPPHDNAFLMKPPEYGNLLVGSELRVKNARDVTGPRDRENERGVWGGGAGGDGGAGLSGLQTVPRGEVGNPDSPWYRRNRGDNHGGGVPDDEPHNYLGHTL